TGAVDGAIVTAETKRELITAAPGPTLAVGDGANDIAMLQAASLAVAMSHRANVRAAADIILPFARLDALIPLLGLKAA
ncbi:MAG: HAD hydrolase family protein, partial [Bowdeniella nasicola]|nr:HAD hydrolase family protein [Bowdeniella nasicola]